MLERLTRLQLQYPKIMLFGLIIIFLIATYLALQLQIDPSFSSLVSDDSEFNTNDRILRASFEANDGLLIVVKQDATSIVANQPEIVSPEVDDYIVRLKETLVQSQYVVSIGDVRYDEDERIAQLVVQLTIPDTTDSFAKAYTELQMLADEAGTPPGILAQVTGLPVLLNRVSTLLIKDNLVTLLITLLAIFLILYWYSKDVVFTLVTITPPILSLILLAMFMVLLNIHVTITLAAVGVLVLGLGADYSIHISTLYRKLQREMGSHEEALIETVKELQIPITASFITTLGGFVALMLGVSPSSQAQGTVLAIAIAVIFVNTFLVFPLLTIMLEKYMHIKENKVFTNIRKGLAKFAVFQAHRPVTVILITLGITVVMLFGASQVQFSTSNSNWIPDSDPISKSFREITYSFGDTDSLRIILTSTQGDLRNVQTARDVNTLVEKLSAIPRVDAVVNPYADVSYSRESAYSDINPAQFNTDYTLTTIVLTSQNFGTDEAGNTLVLGEVRDILKHSPIAYAKTSLYGDAVRFEELGNSLQQDAGVTTMIGLALVFLIASIIYASVVIGALALFPIIVAVIWAVGLMGWFGVPFTSLSTGIISLVLGVGVDFSIHLVDGIKKRLDERGFSIDKAISDTLVTSGSAILLSSLTTFVGFLALTFATLLGTQRLGWSLAFSILSVFIVTMCFVPAVMALSQKLKSTKKTKTARRYKK